jgi:hypothetical protein
MKVDTLVRHLSNPKRIGLTPALSIRLGLEEPEIVRGRLLAQVEQGRGHLGVYLLAIYVVDDTDFWGDGEIYWWSIPALVDRAGKTRRDSLAGLPLGEPPHKCGDREWMTSLSLQDPPLLAVIPPDESVASCVIRLGIYDDDGDVADLPTAMTAGLDALADLPRDPLSGPDQLITPVRDAIYKSLKADDDDILLDQEVPIRRGEVTRFGCGMVNAVINAMARVYYFVRDEAETRQLGPISLEKGQHENLRFDVPMKQGGRLALFARGADVLCPSLGDLGCDAPFKNRVLSPDQARDLATGVDVIGTGPAKLVAFYTPGTLAGRDE